MLPAPQLEHGEGLYLYCRLCSINLNFCLFPDILCTMHRRCHHIHIPSNAWGAHSEPSPLGKGTGHEVSRSAAAWGSVWTTVPPATITHGQAPAPSQLHVSPNTHPLLETPWFQSALMPWADLLSSSMLGSRPPF